jgi:hypothetical protein
MTDYSKSIENFLSLYLSRPGSTLPKNALWVVNFQGLANVKEALLETAKYEPHEWSLKQGLNFYLDNADYSKTCFFIQAVSVPGEQAIINPEGLQYNSFLRTPVGGGRAEYPGLQMTFLDANINFVDTIIRPWVLTTARLGMIARNNAKQRYRTTIEIIKLGTFSTPGPTELQKYTFYDVCPTNVASEEYNYTGATSPTYREVTFTFLDYKYEVLGQTFINENNNFVSETKITPQATGTVKPSVVS